MGSIFPCKGAILRRKWAALYIVQGLSAVSCAKMAEAIEMPFGGHTLVGSTNHVGLLDAGASCRHLVNTTDLSVCCANAALYQIL